MNIPQTCGAAIRVKPKVRLCEPWVNHPEESSPEGATEITGKKRGPRNTVLKLKESGMASTRILYSGFCDFPLAFVTTYEKKQYLFWRGFFDEELDDYPKEYEVFILPNFSEEELKELWTVLPQKAIASIGRIGMRRVMFDPTKRQSINVETFERLVK